MKTLMEKWKDQGQLPKNWDEELEVEVNKWYEDNSTLGLHDWLGMTNEEFDMLAKTPDKFPILFKLKYGIITLPKLEFIQWVSKDEEYEIK